MLLFPRSHMLFSLFFFLSHSICFCFFFLVLFSCCLSHLARAPSKSLFNFYPGKTLDSKKERCAIVPYYQIIHLQQCSYIPQKLVCTSSHFKPLGRRDGQTGLVFFFFFFPQSHLGPKRRRRRRPPCSVHAGSSSIYVPNRCCFLYWSQPWIRRRMCVSLYSGDVREYLPRNTTLEGGMKI